MCFSLGGQAMLPTFEFLFYCLHDVMTGAVLDERDF